MGFEDVEIKIPVSVIIVTKNEPGHRLKHCLAPLSEFAEIFVVESSDNPKTKDIAEEFEADYVPYSWNGQYPKKRQWCLDNLELSCDWVFFVDADEVVTQDLIEEIKHLKYRAAGYFVKGAYVWDDVFLKHGLQNNKLALFDRRIMAFPVVDDLDFPGMGEIEGHYQPVLREGFERAPIGQLKAPLIHYAHDDPDAWDERHERYAAWVAAMDAAQAWPDEPTGFRKFLKRVFQSLPFKPFFAFWHSYVLKLGFLDGAVGRSFAKARARYYAMIAAANKDLARKNAKSSSKIEPQT